MEACYGSLDKILQATKIEMLMVYVGKNYVIGLLRAYVTISSVKILIYDQITNDLCT